MKRIIAIAAFMAVLFCPGDAWGAGYSCRAYVFVRADMVERLRRFPTVIEYFTGYRREIFVQPITQYYSVIYIFGTGDDAPACIVRDGTLRPVRERTA